MSRSNTNGLEGIEAVTGSRGEHSRDLRVPMKLLDVFLTLVDEQELRRDLKWLSIGVKSSRWSLIFVELDRQVPEGDLIVGAGSCEDGRIGRVPFDGCDRSRVPLEVGDGRRCCAVSADQQWLSKLTRLTL
jgi:hypothetical protein